MSLFSSISKIFQGKKKSETAQPGKARAAPRDNAAVFSTRQVRLEREHLAALAPEAQVEEGSADRLGMRTFVCRWNGLTITVHDDPNWNREAQIAGMKGLLAQLTGGEPPSPVRALLVKADETQHSYGCLIEPGYDRERRASNFILALANQLGGYIFSYQSFYTSDGQRIIGLQPDPEHLGPRAPATVAARGLLIQEHEARHPSAEAAARKQRSIAKLKAEGVPVLESLPVVEDSAQALQRSSREVAQRAIAICIAAVKGEAARDGKDQAIIDDFIEEFDAVEYFTVDELEFINDPSPSEADIIKFGWRYECVWVLLWALGYVDELGRPEHICDVPRVVGILDEMGANRFITEAALRPIAEILDAMDLMYRYHWALVRPRDIGLNVPASLDGGVVQEWHYTLNWLTGYMNQNWDDVSTDT